LQAQCGEINKIHEVTHQTVDYIKINDKKKSVFEKYKAKQTIWRYEYTSPLN
jgi:anthranilate/para-aminobenzoate synthase component II